MKTYKIALFTVVFVMIMSFVFFLGVCDYITKTYQTKQDTQELQKK